MESDLILIARAIDEKIKYIESKLEKPYLIGFNHNNEPAQEAEKIVNNLMKEMDEMVVSLSVVLMRKGLINFQNFLLFSTTLNREGWVTLKGYQPEIPLSKEIACKGHPLVKYCSQNQTSALKRSP